MRARVSNERTELEKMKFSSTNVIGKKVFFEKANRHEKKPDLPLPQIGDTILYLIANTNEFDYHPGIPTLEKWGCMKVTNVTKCLVFGDSIKECPGGVILKNNVSYNKCDFTQGRLQYMRVSKLIPENKITDVHKKMFHNFFNEDNIAQCK